MNTAGANPVFTPKPKGNDIIIKDIIPIRGAKNVESLFTFKFKIADNITGKNTKIKEKADANKLTKSFIINARNVAKRVIIKAIFLSCLRTNLSISLASDTLFHSFECVNHVANIELLLIKVSAELIIAERNPAMTKDNAKG